MAVAISAADALTRRLPKLIPPKAHAAGDYLTAGIFLAASTLLWRNHKRAALGAAACGGLKLVTSALTDFDGDNSNLIDLKLHSRVDIGIAAMSAAMPELIGIKEPRAKRFFIGQAIFITALTNLTEFTPATPRRGLFKVRKPA
jgi:hypothetical protein